MKTGTKCPLLRFWRSVSHTWRLRLCDGAGLSWCTFLSTTTVYAKCILNLFRFCYPYYICIHLPRIVFWGQDLYICACARTTNTACCMLGTELFESGQIPAPSESDGYEAVVAGRPRYSGALIYEYIGRTGEMVIGSENQRAALTWGVQSYDTLCAWQSAHQDINMYFFLCHRA
jgi:hypothetical protein